MRMQKQTEVLGYTMDTGVLPVGRFPNVAKRSSCELGSLGSYFFLLSCIWITREIIATMTMQKVSNSSHVTIIVPPFSRGQKKHHPRKKSRGTAYRGAAGSTGNSISYDFSIKWLTPFYPANPSQTAGSGEKCMDLRFFAATPLAAETAAE